MNKIKELREKAGITQMQLAEILKVSQSTIAMWETGYTMPRAGTLPKLAQVLGCSIDDLFEEKAQ